MRRDARVAAEEAAAFNRSAIAGHLVGLGPPAPRDVVRASLLRLANGLVAGYQGVRPELAERIVASLNDGPEPEVRSLGTVGEADLAQNADLAYGALGDFALDAGEAGALLATNAYSTAQAALAVADARAFVDVLDAAAALDFEALRGNVSVLHPAVGEARPHHGTRDALARLRAQLEGSGLWDEGEARFLQDPLSFRCVPQLHGALRDALAYVDAQLAVELNAHQGNPLVVVADDAIVSVGNFESAQLAAALDFLRIALAPVLTAAVERTLKLLSPRFSGLAEGLDRGGGNLGGRALRARRRRAGDRRRGAAPRSARLVRARLDAAGVGRRGPDGADVARGAAALGDARPRRAGRRDRARRRRTGGRPEGEPEARSRRRG